jgi:hypothetical protein
VAPPPLHWILDLGQNCQVLLQLLQYAWVAPSLRESPVANIETPPVKMAPVALPPETPFLFLTALHRTCPRS